MPHGLTTAPANPSPQWPSGYIEALREVEAQEKAIPFYIGWVRGFFTEYPGRRRRDLGRTEIEAFLRKVAARPNVTNWQVQQARESLEVYYERFRGIALPPRPDGVATPTAQTHPAPVRETIRPRPPDQGAGTVQQPVQSKPLHRHGTYTSVRPQVKFCREAIIPRAHLRSGVIGHLPGILEPGCPHPGLPIDGQERDEGVPSPEEKAPNHGCAPFRNPLRNRGRPLPLPKRPLSVRLTPFDPHDDQRDWARRYWRGV